MEDGPSIYIPVDDYKSAWLFGVVKGRSEGYMRHDAIDSFVIPAETPGNPFIGFTIHLVINFRRGLQQGDTHSL